MGCFIISQFFRASDIRSTVAQHNKPQIKRSVSFLKKMMHKIEDIRELVFPFIGGDAVTETNVVEANEVFGSMGDLLTAVEDLLEHEMNMNWCVLWFF